METAKKKAATYKLANYHHVGTWNQHCHMFNFSRDDRTLDISCEMNEYLNVGK